MQVETKFLRLPHLVMIGTLIDGWPVCWLGGWDRNHLVFWVMVAHSEEDVVYPSPQRS